MKISKLFLLLSLMFSFNLSRAQTPDYLPLNKLAGWWPFNGNAKDESGKGNHGTVNGATLVSSRNAKDTSAYSFAGNSIDISNPSGLPLSNSARTVAFWFQIPSYTEGCMLSYGGMSKNGKFSVMLIMQYPAFTSFSRVYLSTEFGDFGDSSRTYPDKWHHLALVYSTDTLKVFLDGKLKSASAYFNSFSGDPVNTMNTVSGNLVFGTSISNNEPFYGKLDDIGIWSRALSTYEIRNLFEGCTISLTKEPVDQNVNPGNNVRFVVSASASDAVFQWQTNTGSGFQDISNTGQFTGASNDTLWVSNISTANNNQAFRCIVSYGVCRDTSRAAVLTVKQVGTGQTPEKSCFRIYPNPAVSEIFVNIPEHGAEYTLYNQTGQLILWGKSETALTHIDIQNLPEGIYHFRAGGNYRQYLSVIRR